MMSSIDRRGVDAPRSLQGANGFEPAEDADRAVVLAGVGNRVGVRAGGDRRQRRVGSFPAGEDVADGVVAHLEAGFLEQCR